MSLTNQEPHDAKENDGTCEGCTSRRHLLTVSSLAGVTTLGLAACGSSNAASQSSTAAAPASPTGEATVAIPLSDLAVGAKGTAKLDGGRSYLFYRVSETDIKAYRAVCTHAGCLVEVGADKDFACPCHGSMFDPATGAPTAGPAPSALAAYPAGVEGSNVVIYLEG
ncbi:Rieske 2Fe-2S domain-containing protein [Neomicrococcus lactis]|uniref:Cytochrome bc1 complex Rieske iron-sulfur subunit n=1 Tax=Neomicrococcus lactis TaxID=732241 RepID=A0A7W8Y9K6_9MICC|nr:Rieske Fe-S protein [Neomicrococcus lactis]